MLSEIKCWTLLLSSRYSVSRCHNPHEEAQHRHDNSQPLGVCVRRARDLGGPTDPQKHPGGLLPGQSPAVLPSRPRPRGEHLVMIKENGFCFL